MDDVIFSREDRIELITLNRPDMLNAINGSILTLLSRKLNDLALDDDVRAVVMTGSGKGFSTGADLTGSDMRSDVNTPVGMRLSTQLYSSVIQAMAELEKPIIGAINGVAAGAGCNLALACDILIAAESARFIEVFVRRGLVADAGGTFFLPRRVGLAKAKELMFTGEAVDAAQALELGLINKVVPDDRLMDEAMDLARRLARGPTRAIGMMKSMLNRSYESDLRTALEREATLQGIAVSTADVLEGVTSFLEKRQPEFKGK
ncbi:MAG: enoyl-CoA hydratase/isomerase family protein [Deltaproteobacteria bacterium]|nr:enoyl-CoA hydratase/isomerase family protein [Deltaproteobacteria bacterium]